MLCYLHQPATTDTRMSDRTPPTNDANDAQPRDPAGAPPDRRVTQIDIAVDVDRNVGGTVTGASIGQVTGDATVNVVGGDQHNVNTGGGDYAEHTIDKRQGTFVTDSTIIGPVIDTS
jgi:hypothetical protein